MAEKMCGTMRAAIAVATRGCRNLRHCKAGWDTAEHDTSIARATATAAISSVDDVVASHRN